MDVKDAAAEKEFDIAIQMTMKHFSSEIQENKTLNTKTLLTKIHKC